MCRGPSIGVIGSLGATIDVMAWSGRLRVARAALVLLLALGGCDLSDKPVRRDAGPRGDDPPSVAASLSLGPPGGVVAITERESDLFGANLVVPPESLRRFTDVSLERAEALPEGSNALGAGAPLSVQPEDLAFRTPATLEMPVPAGFPVDGLTIGRWDAEAGTWVVPATAETHFDDPRTNRGGYVRVSVEGGGLYRLLFEDPQPVDVLNDGSGPIAMAVATQRFTTEGGRGYVPPPPGRGELEAPLEAHDTARLLLLPGEYILHATFEGESVPRCERVTVIDPVSSTEPLEVSFSDFTPPCPLPAVRLTATPRTVASNEEVTLQAVGTATGGSDLTWHWLASGGTLAGEATGTTPSGDVVETTWLAPDAPGTYYISFVAADDDEWFAEAHTTVEVTTRNQRPQIAGFSASPLTIGPGFPDGARIAEPGTPGVTRVRTVVSDLDGDEVSVYWQHREPGNWYDVDSGAKLASDEETGLVVWPETGEPYTAEQILYMAPPSGFVETLSNGMWLPATVSASDGELTDRAWRMINVVRQAEPPPVDAGPLPDGGRTDAGPPRDAGPRDAGSDGGPDASIPPVTGRCLSVLAARCEMYTGSAYRSEQAALEESCTSMGWTWTSDFACPESGSIGACYRFHEEAREAVTVHYDTSPTADRIDMLRDECEALSVAEGGPGVWVRPYRAPR